MHLRSTIQAFQPTLHADAIVHRQRCSIQAHAAVRSQQLHQNQIGSHRTGVGSGGVELQHLARQLPSRRRQNSGRCAAWGPIGRRHSAQQTAQQGQVAVDPGPPHGHYYVVQQHGTLMGGGWAALILVCTTIMTICAAATAFMLSIRPFLENLAKASLATEKAAVEMEAASKEVERAALKFQTEVDLTLPEVAAASREFQALGRSVNTLGGLTGIGRPMAGMVQQSTSNSLRKVVNDVSQLTNALTPTMAEWKKRMSWMSKRFEAVREAEQPAGRLPTAQLTEKQQVQAWIAAWRQRTAVADSAAAPVAMQSAAQQVQQYQQQPQQKREQMAGLQQDRAAALERKQLAGFGDNLASTNDDSEESMRAARNEARMINAAAEAAEKMADQANKMTADIQADIRASSSISQPRQPVRRSSNNGRPLGLQSLTDEDVELLERLKDRRSAAESVYNALRRAEQAANAAAQASGVLEEVLQEAEQQGRRWPRQQLQERFQATDGNASDSGCDEPSELPRDGMAAMMPDAADRGRQ